MRVVIIFIIILFLIGILFVVGITLGVNRSDNRTFQMPTWLSGLGGVLSRPQALKTTELTPAQGTPASCLQQGRFTVPMGNTCTFAIQQSLFALREVRLQLVTGVSAMVTLTQEKALPVQQSLTGTSPTTNADMKVYPGKTQGMLSIACSNAGGMPACLLVLK